MSYLLIAAQFLLFIRTPPMLKKLSFVSNLTGNENRLEMTGLLKRQETKKRNKDKQKSGVERKKEEEHVDNHVHDGPVKKNCQ